MLGLGHVPALAARKVEKIVREADRCVVLSSVPLHARMLVFCASECITLSPRPPACVQAAAVLLAC